MANARSPWLAGVLYLLGVWPVAAQHWNFATYGADLGLTNSNVLALHQDPQGFLWISTESGLFRYDGDRFHPFAVRSAKKSVEIGFFHNSVDGQFWAASSAGLFHWSKDTFVAVAGFAETEFPAGMAIGSDAANLYVATSQGLHALPLKSGPVQLLSRKPSRSVLAAADRTVWFGCGTLLCSLRDGRVKEWGAADGVTSGPWQGIAEDAAGRLWIRSNDTLLVREKTGAPFHSVRNLPRLESTHNALLTTDHLGRILIPHASGLAICDAGECRNYGSESGLRRAEVYSVMEDREGSLWIGYSGHGVARWLGGSQWQSLAEEEGLLNPGIWRIVRGASGDLWIGTNRGLFHGSLRNGRWSFERSEAVGNGTVYGLAMESDGSLWIGTFQLKENGLVRYDPRTRRRSVYSSASPVPRLSINDLNRGDDGAVWLATPFGVMRLRRGAGQLERVSLPLDGAPVFEVRRSRQEFIAAGKKGLYIERGAFRRLLTVADGLKDNAVETTTTAPDGALWITYFAPLGITRVEIDGDRVRMQHFAEADGLPSDTVYSQFFDAGGRHWLGTGNGVAVHGENRWVTYDTSDGLVWNDCNSHAYYAEPDGTVWIGTSHGLARFHPSAQPLYQPPAALITAVQRNEQPTQATDFDSNTYSLVLRFTTLFFQRKEASFRYRLGTSSTPWVQTQGHEVRFAALPAGSYRFEVQGEAHSGMWGPSAIWNFRIRPPWYLKWQCQCGALVLLGLLAWLDWRRREIRQCAIREALEAAVAQRTEELRTAQDDLELRVEERTRDLENEITQRKAIERDLLHAKATAEESNRAKSDFLANMSHELRTPLNAILGYSELLEEEAQDVGTAEALNDLRKIASSGKQLLGLVNDVLDLAKIEAGKMTVSLQSVAVADLLREARQTAEPLARKQGNRFVVEDGHRQDSLLVDPIRFRQSLLNLLSNACKFTENGQVTLTVDERVQKGENWSCWQVSDNGIGIPEESIGKLFQNFSQVDDSPRRKHGGTGLGLAISQRFCQMMGGHITVESEPGHGSAFTIHIPLTR